MKAVKGLQKLTDEKPKFLALFDKPAITLEDVQHLDREGLVKFTNEVISRLNSLKFGAFDRFYDKVEGVLDPETKNRIWETNHFMISSVIHNNIQEHGYMPTKQEIARAAGLSRQTVHKHINEYADHPQFKEQAKQFKLMTSQLLATLYQRAIAGDMKAAKVYFMVMGSMNTVKNQNNYIQINGMVINQESIAQLTQEELSKVEAILKPALTVV